LLTIRIRTVTFSAARFARFPGAIRVFRYTQRWSAV